MKKFLTFLMIFFFAQPGFADMVLQGAAEYNVQSARNEVQENVQYKVSPANFSAHILDPNRDENSNALKGNVSLKDRAIAAFSIGTYGVTYNNDPLHAYYYSPQGVLNYIDVRSGKDYPYKSYQYDVSGKLVNMGLRVSKAETYIYNPQGILMAHWVGSNGYDENGKLVMTRQYKE